MNEQATTTAVAEATPATGGMAAAAPASEPLTTASNPWAMKAEVEKNDDVYVQVTDPLFDKQTKLATVTACEPGTVEEERGETLRVSFRLEEPLVDTFGQTKTPGYVLRPRPYVLKAAKSDEKALQKAEIDSREVAKLCMAAGTLPRLTAFKRSDLYNGIAKLEGRKVLLNFSLRAGTRRNEDGSFQQFQNLGFAAPGAGAVGAVGAAGAVNGAKGEDY